MQGNVYYIPLYSALDPNGAGDINNCLLGTYALLKYGTVTRFHTSIAFEGYLNYNLKPSESIILVRSDTRVSETLTNIDRGFAMAGDDVLFVFDTAVENAYDWRKDLDNYQIYFTTHQSEWMKTKVLIHGKSTRSHSKKYQPFGIDRTGNPGNGIVAIKIFKQ